MAQKKALSITEIEDNLLELVRSLRREEFIVDFLSNFAIPKTSINRAKNKFSDGNAFRIKNKLYYAEVNADVVRSIDTIQRNILGEKSAPRFIIANNFERIAAVDTKTKDNINILFSELPQHVDFFLPWNGIEKADYQAESPADRKAATRFTRLYAVLKDDNPNVGEHEFNVFLTRVLFLLFAEDTSIMPKGIFTNALKTRTNVDGSDLNDIIATIFSILNFPVAERSIQENWLSDFPYVNGNLFKEKHSSLLFTSNSRRLLIEAGELLNWQEINPDILGSMIQSVASTDNRQVTGMHYTSVPNIMKVIKPLFLDELNDTFDSINKRSKNDVTRVTRQKIVTELQLLHNRISNIKFLDPASGSGNFLIITYKEIRRLEIKIILLEQKLEHDDQMPMTSIHLGNFSGIEIEDFAHEVSKVSLWIAEHQMNEEMKVMLPGSIAQLLPLRDSGNIIRGNALRLDWNDLFSHNVNDEVYIIGNPPYRGAKLQTKSQKEDLAHVLQHDINSKKVDYITGWFYKGSLFIKGHRNSKLAFVSTNSINQGEQVSLIWPFLLRQSIISFAYLSFKWGNSAKNNAGVTVVIVGLESKQSDAPKYIYYKEGRYSTEVISPYLTPKNNVVVYSKSESISKLPDLVLGNKPLDFGGLTLSENEYLQAIQEYPPLAQVIRKFIGAEEYINGTKKYAFWFDDNNHKYYEEKYPFIKKRIAYVENKRLIGGSSAKAMAKTPYKFFTFKKFEEAVNRHYKKHADSMFSIIIPSTSSENRKYVPMGLVDDSIIISSAAMVIYDAPMWLLGLLESRMHMVWLRSVGGKLKTDYRYSAGLVYNTFPIKNISTQRKNEMTKLMTEILELREYLGGTFAELYNTETMPAALRKKHEELDATVDRAYQQRSFDSDEDRLSMLLNLYQKMTSEEG